MSKIEVNAVEPQCGTTLTLGASGDTVALASGAKMSGVQAVSWQTGSIKTSGFTAAAGEGYFCNTSSSAFTVTLPSGSSGAVVAVSDYTRTFQTNNLTIAPQSGEKIGGVAANATLSTEGQTATFVYVDSTEGWINVQETSNSVTGETFITATGGTITCCGDYKIHTFTGPGTFCVSQIATVAANNEVSYIVVAGGAAGGGHCASGGGGAGGFRESKSGVDCYSASPLEGATPITITAQGYPITVGGGGSNAAQGPYTNPPCTNNGNPSVFSIITSAQGGGGGNYNSDPTPSTKNGASGGSGGGGATTNNAPGSIPSGGAGGSGNNPPVSPSQGNNGGSGRLHNSPGTAVFAAGGGGGATVAGTPSLPGAGGGPGGNGATTSISASPTTYAGGGGGSSCGPGPAPGATQGLGGSGGGGNGGMPGVTGPLGPGVAGTANTGGGGGGGRDTKGGNGGSGIVIIRYKYQ